MSSFLASLASDRSASQVPERVPALLAVGLALMAGAFGLDLVAHGAALESVESTAHAAGMLGMVTTWSAVVVDGLRPTARRA